MNDQQQLSSLRPDSVPVNGHAICSLCPARHRGACEHFSEALSAALKEISTDAPVRKGATLAAAGGKANAMFIVKQGEFKAVRILPDGRRQIIGFVEAGDIVGGPYPDCTYDCTFEALVDSIVCRFPRRDLEIIAREHPEFVRTLLALTFLELKQRNNQAVMLGRKSADERVASFLLERRRPVDPGQPQSNHTGHTILTMSRAEIADYLGLTIETVSRTLSQFRQNGFLEISQYKKIDMVDASGLRRLAGDAFTEPYEARVFM